MKLSFNTSFLEDNTQFPCKFPLLVAAAGSQSAPGQGNCGASQTCDYCQTAYSGFWQLLSPEKNIEWIPFYIRVKLKQDVFLCYTK